MTETNDLLGISIDASSDKTRETFDGETLAIRYIPLSEARLWDSNPKLHSTGDIIESIRINGFKDEPIYDKELRAFAAGNGRTECLMIMYHDHEPAPRGILVHKTTGEWWIPVKFGVDAFTPEMAKRFALDHNNLPLTGSIDGGIDMMKMYDIKALAEVMDELVESGDNLMPITFTIEDVNNVLDSVNRASKSQDITGSDGESEANSSSRSQKHLDGDDDEGDENWQDDEDGGKSQQIPPALPSVVVERFDMWLDTMSDFINQFGEFNHEIEDLRDGSEITGKNAKDATKLIGYLVTASKPVYDLLKKYAKIERE